jgi:DMSO/TMAO reductase YedYZ molybdopterin-dependent catalytic subunit
MYQFDGIDRRTLLRATLLGTAAALTSCTREGSSVEEPPTSPDDPSSNRDLRPLAKFPEKDPLILLTDRPPQLETPLHYFREDLTPNEAHFVRWHLAGIPESVDLKTWRLQVSGNVTRPLKLSLDDLQHKFESTSIVALNQCSGNGRSLFEPRVPGGQWRHGAMSNARWTGVRLKEILDHAGLRPKTIEISLRGLDNPPLAGTPPFEKSLTIDIAQNPDVLVAYAMNDKPLPMLNGFPARLIVPGWYATYWVKSLSRITALDTPLHNFWMDKAYRIPNNKAAAESPTQQVADTVPINRMAVHSIFVSPEPGETLKAEHAIEVQGVATDSGQGIRVVEISTDNGANWTQAKLDPELGRYSWRRWRFSWTPPKKGTHRLLVRATNNAGEGQLQQQWNHSGYQRATVEHVDVRVV